MRVDFETSNGFMFSVFERLGMYFIVESTQERAKVLSKFPTITLGEVVDFEDGTRSDVVTRITHGGNE